MSNDAQLKPVFVPALAELLAHAEKSKGSALTEAEALRIRNRGVCVMMSPERARHTDQSRGFQDVNPDNCIAEWHRMRVPLTGCGYLPKLILCLPGGDDFQAQCESVLQKAGVEHEFRGLDTRIVSAFEAAMCRVRPSLDARDLEALGRHSTVLYIISRNFTPQQSATVSRDFLRLGRQLLEAGGIAVKCESSGVAHSAAFWKELTGRAETGASGLVPTPDYWSAIYAAYVKLPIQSANDFYSCGMHLLGQPDMIVSCTLMNEALADGESPTYRAIDLFDGFSALLLSEYGEKGFISGHRFRLKGESRLYQVTWEPCEGYDEDEFFFNPYGRWRFANPAPY